MVETSAECSEHTFDEGDWGKLSLETQAQFYELACLIAPLTERERRFLLRKAKLMRIVKSRAVVLGVVVALAGLLIFALSKSVEATIMALAVGIIIGIVLSLSTN